MYLYIQMKYLIECMKPRVYHFIFKRLNRAEWRLKIKITFENNL